MAQLAREAQLDPVVRETAIRLVASLGTMDYPDAARRFYWWVRRTLKRIDEGIELIQRPEWLLRESQAHRVIWGDCDDGATLFAALAFAIGIPVRFVAVARPAGLFEHVFPEVFLVGAWRMADPFYDRMPPGEWLRLEVEV